MTNIQYKLIEYIDDEDVDDEEDKFKDIKDLLAKYKIQDNKHELVSFLYLLIKISNHHRRIECFFNKIEQILEHLKEVMTRYFSNSELFHIFKSNKRILLFLFEENIMNFDEFIAKRIIRGKYLSYKYPQFFQPEIEPFMNKIWFPEYDKNKEDKTAWILEIQKEIPKDFFERRKIGENETFICKLIRKDLLDDFIVYVNKINYPINSIINPSIYETNNFLLKNNPTTLIEYAAFFGSIQIFNYLKFKSISLTHSLWFFSIHSNNAELIQILEENNLDQPIDNSCMCVIKESFKCHHIDFANYFQNNYFENEKDNEEVEKEIFYEMINSIKYYNFIFIENNLINEKSFNYLCKYDYYILVSILLKTKNIDVNNLRIKNYICFYYV